MNIIIDWFIICLLTNSQNHTYIPSYLLSSVQKKIVYIIDQNVPIFASPTEAETHLSNPLPATSLTFRCFCHSQVQANSPSWQIFGTLSLQIFAYAHMQRIKTTAAAAACYRSALHNLTSTYTQQRCLLWRKLQSQLLTPLISQRSYLPLLPQCKYPHENNKSRGKPQWRILFPYHLVHRLEK